ncbi:MAG: Ig-like domain-containing protein [Nitrospirae bacterium]|nr:Ig-like domain-containing protein [Nitrospirota bacterium]
MTSNRFPYITAGLLLLLCFALTACPDGGNGEPVSWFSSVYPLDGATCTPVDVQVKVVFSDALTQALADTAKITLSDGAANVPLSVVYNDAKTEATISPSTALEFGKTYTATIELVGQETKIWTFSTFDAAACDPPGPPTTTTTTLPK